MRQLILFAEQELNDIRDYFLATYPGNPQNAMMVSLIEDYAEIE